MSNSDIGLVKEKIKKVAEKEKRATKRKEIVDYVHENKSMEKTSGGYKEIRSKSDIENSVDISLKRLRDRGEVKKVGTGEYCPPGFMPENDEIRKVMKEKIRAYLTNELGDLTQLYEAQTEDKETGDYKIENVEDILDKDEVDKVMNRVANELGVEIGKIEFYFRNNLKEVLNEL